MDRNLLFPVYREFLLRPMILPVSSRLITPGIYFRPLGTVNSSELCEKGRPKRKWDRPIHSRTERRQTPAFVLVRTKLWTLKPVCGQERMRSAHSGLRSSRPTRNDSTSRAKRPANRASSIRGIVWKTPAASG